MRKQYVIVDTAVNVIENVCLTKPQNPGPYRTVYECELSTYNRLMALKKSGASFDGFDYTIENGILYAKGIYELRIERQKREELEDKIDRIMDCSRSRYLYTSDYKMIFNSLSAEEKLEALFELTLRALVRLNDKQDKPSDDMY